MNFPKIEILRAKPSLGEVPGAQLSQPATLRRFGNQRKMTLHRVEYGQTLVQLAREYGVTVDDILLLNPELLTPDALPVGSFIDIPVMFRGAATVAPGADADGRLRAALRIVAHAKRLLYLCQRTSGTALQNVPPTERHARCADYRDALKKSSWRRDWPQHTALCEAVWGQAYAELHANPAVNKEIARRLDPDAKRCLRNWREIGAVSRHVSPGSICFIQHGQYDVAHLGIVVRVFERSMATVEAAIDAPGRQVATATPEIVFRTRVLRYEQHPSWWVQGFLNPLALV